MGASRDRDPGRDVRSRRPGRVRLCLHLDRRQVVVDRAVRLDRLAPESGQAANGDHPHGIVDRLGESPRASFVPRHEPQHDRNQGDDHDGDDDELHLRSPLQRISGEPPDPRSDASTGRCPVTLPKTTSDRTTWCARPSGGSGLG